jgi:hypothetical protein
LSSFLPKLKNDPSGKKTKKIGFDLKRRGCGMGRYMPLGDQKTYFEG